MDCLASIFCKRAIEHLDQSKSYAEDWVKLRMEFYYTYQNTYVFPSFGAEFFEVIYDWIVNRKDYIEAKPFINSEGKTVMILPEYEKNFNAWLKTVRSSK